MERRPAREMEAGRERGWGVGGDGWANAFPLWRRIRRKHGVVWIETSAMDAEFHDLNIVEGLLYLH